jgi:hypothetical protein
MICPTAKAESFFKRNWTGQIGLKWLQKIARLRDEYSLLARIEPTGFIKS